MSQITNGTWKKNKKPTWIILVQHLNFTRKFCTSGEKWIIFFVSAARKHFRSSLYCVANGWDKCWKMSFHDVSVWKKFWTLLPFSNAVNVKICCVLKQSVCLQPSPEGTCLSHQNWLRENKSMQMNEWKLGHQIAASKRHCGFHYMVTCHEKIVVAHSRESSRHPVWMEMLGFCLNPCNFRRGSL